VAAGASRKCKGKGILTNLRLQDADAADLTQIVLLQVSGSVRRFDYDPQRGSFRGWLFGLVRNQLNKFHSAERRHQQKRVGCEALDDVADESDSSAEELELWEREFEQQLFLRAAEQLKGQMAKQAWDAFWRTVVNNEGAPQVARLLGMSVGAVYTAKSRMIDRMRHLIAELREEWNPG
jgi:RNA polymerase sigma factor (sigma-70 family)